MHQSVMTWVAEQVNRLGIAHKSVLDVGSFDVNGSVRPLFNGPYLGVDMRDGPGVDLVAPAHLLPFDDDRFDVVVSTEMLEHDPWPWLSVKQMARVVRPGGYVILTARGYNFPHHDFPADYWRFSTAGLRSLIAQANLDAIIVIPDPCPDNPGVFGLATKPVPG